MKSAFRQIVQKTDARTAQFSVYFPIHQVLQSQNTGNGAVTHIERVAMAPTSPAH
jgi:hypothetical protein